MPPGYSLPPKSAPPKCGWLRACSTCCSVDIQRLVWNINITAPFLTNERRRRLAEFTEHHAAMKAKWSHLGALKTRERKSLNKNVRTPDRVYRSCDVTVSVSNLWANKWESSALGTLIVRRQSSYPTQNTFTMWQNIILRCLCFV